MCGLARRQSSFPPGTFAPYQVRLDNGKLIYAPIDEDRVCRAYVGEEADADDFLEDEEELPEEQKLAVTVRRPPARSPAIHSAASPRPRRLPGGCPLPERLTSSASVRRLRGLGLGLALPIYVLLTFS